MTPGPLVAIVLPALPMPLLAQGLAGARRAGGLANDRTGTAAGLPATARLTKHACGGGGPCGILLNIGSWIAACGIAASSLDALAPD